ncbi:MAG TPA: V-type ATP synthase subunit K [Treponemataceae bacterium]|jgi:V/A-type H+-transporting ATPase subunit K|nr:MAG: V-type ATP synthase subunit K [Treponema sp.]HOC30308.1 V-type ATP synthase subunit K [Treponemataceae bacterium]HQL32549.1 V-type ATP synthase subunit K [Treponemataceae bacterium]
MNFGMFGAACALGLAAIGSSIGLAIAGQATIGSWKRCYMNNKPAPFVMVAFAGAPLTQTIYGFLLMNAMLASAKDPWYLLGVGLVCGLAIGSSAVAQGMAGASGSDAIGETGKGFSQFITIVGLCETVALFVMVFGLISV